MYHGTWHSAQQVPALFGRSSRAARSAAMTRQMPDRFTVWLVTDKPLLNFVSEPELLTRVDDFRYKNRFPTRAAAIKWLLAWALDQKPAPAKEG